MDDFQLEINQQVREFLAADREEIARQCSEAHGRFDYQFCTQEASMERIRVEQQEIAAIEGLDRRVLDREHQELEKLRQHVTEEVQLTIANALKALEPVKEREQRKLKQHQRVVERKVAELDQMMQLIGRQLIQNTSQLQVVRNEQLEYNLQVEDAGFTSTLQDSAELLARRSQHQELQQQLDKKLRDYSQVLVATQGAKEEQTNLILATQSPRSLQ
ncbi:uncharacterized protein PITG_13759 [Phytophthora infestans T30-4]|uniref:Uncharacterized protein n=1 Tax=Phytophthora infestans (strain T30-4) TaxID=403677 RepID=D0NMQ7_PHYIT|nr:uncharacterized protein PITG_13759 [Phytophthora infestans T30-4]EEY61814.1 conserved hypothetical protein [Phytophthora infestans T30-4]|eukprot:XP_002899454.1 conserved hypothetical protein [Phytophthora infestans T30-4]